MRVDMPLNKETKSNQTKIQNDHKLIAYLLKERNMEEIAPFSECVFGM